MTTADRICQERLAICEESGVPTATAYRLAVLDGKRCAEGRPCICVESKREEGKR